MPTVHFNVTSSMLYVEAASCRSDLHRRLLGLRGTSREEQIPEQKQTAAKARQAAEFPPRRSSQLPSSLSLPTRFGDMFVKPKRLPCSVMEVSLKTVLIDHRHLADLLNAQSTTNILLTHGQQSWGAEGGRAGGGSRAAARLLPGPAEPAAGS